MDTDVLLRYSNSSDPVHRLCRSSVAALILAGEPLYIGTQNLIEAWGIATRPIERGGYGLDVLLARRMVDTFAAPGGFLLLTEPARIYERWRDLVTQYQVLGRQVHDTRLVALMLESGVDRILTLNGDDFKRFREITPVHPTDVPLP